MNLAPVPFSLRQLQYAVAVADALSFRAAAERCHVSQPSLSAQLAELENALGVQLFERDKRRVLLTRAGAVLVERARALLVDAEALVEAARRMGDPFHGTFRVGVIPTVSPYLLPALTPKSKARHPKLSLVWVEDKTEVLAKSLQRGELDAALLALEAELGEVEAETIAKDYFQLAMAASHPLAQSEAPTSAAELRKNTVLLLDEGHCLREQALSFCTKAKAQELEFRATSLPTLAQMVASGMGVTLLPELAIPTETRRASLAVRPFAKPAPYRTIALVWRRRSPLAGALRKLAETIREAYPGR